MARSRSVSMIRSVPSSCGRHRRALGRRTQDHAAPRPAVHLHQQRRRQPHVSHELASRPRPAARRASAQSIGGSIPGRTVKYVTPKLERLWKKCEPWLGSTVMPAMLVSTIDRAPAMLDQSTGIPSHGSELPQRPKPMRRYGRPASTRRPVQVRDVGRDGARPSGVERLGADEDDVDEPVVDAVAHDRLGHDEAARVVQLVGRDRHRLRRDGHRAHLQEARGARADRPRAPASARIRFRPARRAPPRTPRAARGSSRFSGSSSSTSSGAKVSARGPRPRSPTCRRSDPAS